MLRKRIRNEKNRVRALREALADQVLANENNQNGNEGQGGYECKICFTLSSILMSCENCGFANCVPCHERRPVDRDICYFCNVTSVFHKCRLD